MNKSIKNLFLFMALGCATLAFADYNPGNNGNKQNNNKVSSNPNLKTKQAYYEAHKKRYQVADINTNRQKNSADRINNGGGSGGSWDDSNTEDYNNENQNVEQKNNLDEKPKEYQKLF